MDAFRAKSYFQALLLLLIGVALGAGAYALGRGSLPGAGLIKEAAKEALSDTSDHLAAEIQLGERPSLPRAQEQAPASPKANNLAAAENISLGNAVAASIVKECEWSAASGMLGEVRFSEVAWMGDEEDPKNEWMELENSGATEVVIAGWEIVNSSSRLRVILPDGARIPANGFYLLRRAEYAATPAGDAKYSGVLANSGDELILFDADCAVRDRVDAAKGWNAGSNESKRTMERMEDGAWQTSANAGGTPRAKNSEGHQPAESANIEPITPNSEPATLNEQNTPASTPSVPPPPAPMNARVLLSEIFFDAEGTDTGKEFIELYSVGPDAADLKNWKITKNGSSFLTIGSKVEDRTTLSAGAFYIIGLSNYEGAADMKRSATLPNTGATIALINSDGAAVDTASYIEGTPGESIARVSWGGSEFRPGAPTPGR